MRHRFLLRCTAPEENTELYLICDPWPWGNPHEAARVHFAPRAVRRSLGRSRRGRSSADRMRRVGVFCTSASDDAEVAGPHWRHSCRRLRALGLGHRQQSADRLSLVGTAIQSAVAEHRGGIARARAGRRPGYWRCGTLGTAAAGDPHRPDRLHADHRSGSSVASWSA